MHDRCRICLPDLSVSQPHAQDLIAPGVIKARWWRKLDDGRVQCELCPRQCRLNDGQRGFCFIRENRDGVMVMTSYARASGLCIDPIEKKPLNHFLPGSTVLSLGTAGCNLGCRFCQNWDMSRARKFDRMNTWVAPEQIAEVAKNEGCRSVAFTYNEPIIFAEFAIDAARACRAQGIRTVAVTAGYILPEARQQFFGAMDAVNVDLKAFSEQFYRKLCLAHLQPVLDTLAWLRSNTEVWIEVTTLLVPGSNDDDAELRQLSAWCNAHLGAHTPIHFTAYHPAYRHHATATSEGTLQRARDIAMAEGMQHVYTGNVRDEVGQSTYCTGCGAVLVRRCGYRVQLTGLDKRGRCRACGRRLEGVFDVEEG